MALRIVHKGIILVALPLALQLLIIALLGLLLYQTDREQSREAERCRLSMIGSRLLFANCDAGNILINAFRLQNIRMLDYFFVQCDEIDKLNQQMATVPADDAVEGRGLQQKCLKAQSAVTARMREIGELATGGFGMGTLRAVLECHRKLIKELDVVFGLLRMRWTELDSGLPAKWKQLDHLYEQENLVLLYSFIATSFVSAFLVWYYRKEFLLRIDRVKGNVESLTLGNTLGLPMRGQDEIAQLDASFHNMSMQLAAVAERERALFQNSSDMICVLDENLKFIRLNDSATRFYSQDPKTLNGKSVAALFQNGNDTEIKQVEEQIKNARSTQTAVNFEANLEGPGAKEMVTLWSIFWSPDQKACHCVVHDVTEERHLDKMREAFLKLIAADFSKPLNHIAELVDRLASGETGELPESATKKISSATSTLARLVNMVDELVQLETVKSTSLNLVKKNTRVLDVLQETVKDTEAAADRKQIKMTVECPDDLTFNVDFDRVVRVLMNFSSNAIKFSPEGETVLLKAELNSASAVQISVIDHGRGIPNEALSGLFQAFKQVDSADGKRGKGTGLGLVVCKRIVEEHGGAVGVSSEENKGSCFWLTIPTSQDNSTALTTQTSSSDAPTTPAVASPSTDLSKLSKSNNIRTNFWERLTFKQKGVLLIGMPILFQGIFMGAMFYCFNESAQSFAKQMHNRVIVRNSIRTATPFFQLLVGLRTEGQANMGLHICRTVQSEERLRVEALRDSVKNDQLASEHSKTIERYLKGVMLPLLQHLMEDLSEASGQLDEEDNRRYANVLVRQIGGLTLNVQQLVNACDKRDKDTPVRLKELRRIELIALIIALVFNIGAAAWLAIFFSSDVVRRLLVLSDNSQRLTTGTPLNQQLTGTDEIAHLDASFHETAQRLAAARATESTFLDNANNIICSMDRDGRFTSINRVAAEKFLIPFDKYSEYKLSGILPETEKSNCDKFLERVKESTTPATIEFQIQSEDRPLDLVLSVLWSENEKQFFAVGYDITTRRDLDRMKKEFLALVTHDLRTPLTTIQGMAIILETDKLGTLPPAARACIAEIRQQTKQIIELVNDLLDLSKLEAGELKCDATVINFSALFNKIEDLLEESTIQIHTSSGNLEDREKIRVNADLDRLAYAIAGITHEVFEDESVLRMSLSLESEKLLLTVVGDKLRISEHEIDLINNADMSAQSTSSTHRLRLPLAKKLLQMHEASARIIPSTSSPDAAPLCLQFEIPTV